VMWPLHTGGPRGCNTKCLQSTRGVLAGNVLKESGHDLACLLGVGRRMLYIAMLIIARA
jgi:hypothetical protein